MKDSWANNHPERDAAGPVGSGLDLHVELTGPRVRAALETALRQAVQTGRLAAGTRLPASRTLAADLGVARNTVADVYGQLVAEGWLTARQGSGTRVAEHPAAEPPAVAAPPVTVPDSGESPRYSLKARTARPERVSAHRVAGGGEEGSDGRGGRGLRLRGPVRAARVACRARRVPGPGARRAGRRGPDRDLLRVHPGAVAPRPGAGGLGCRRCWGGGVRAPAAPRGHRGGRALRPASAGRPARRGDRPGAGLRRAAAHAG